MTIRQLLMVTARLPSASADFRFSFRPLARHLRKVLAVPLLLLGAPASALAQYETWTNDDGTVAITGYTGSGGAVTIPGIIDGRPVTSIGPEAFEDSGLTSVTIPDSVMSVGWNAFFDCFNLTSVSIGRGTININGTGDLVNKGEVAVFDGCVSLTNFSVDPLNAAYASLDGVLLNKTEDRLVICPAGKSGSYSVPDSVTEIGLAAFYACTGLTHVVIPESVTEVGADAFWGCSLLTDVAIPRSVTYIGDAAFSACSGLRSIFFAGNTPSVLGGATGVMADTNVTIYYRPGTTGWGGGGSFGGCPAVLWNPAIQIHRAGGGPQANTLALTIVGTPNIPFVLVAAANVTSGPWTPLQTSTLTNGLISFFDPEWTSHPARFYRIRSP